MLGAMFETKMVLGVLTILIGIVSYSLYFRGIFRKQIRPDAFSWLTWGILAAVTFFAQYVSGAGAGMWITGFTALMCTAIGMLAIWYGYGKPKLIDAISVAGALAGLILWWYADDPLLAVLCVIFVGAIGFVPTFYKAYRAPGEEGLSTFAMNTLKFVVALFALEAFTPTTYLYPLAEVILNGSLSGMLFMRGRRSAQAKPHSASTTP